LCFGQIKLTLAQLLHGALLIFDIDSGSIPFDDLAGIVTQRDGPSQ
jgi:hypothetical protein